MNKKDTYSRSFWVACLWLALGSCGGPADLWRAPGPRPGAATDANAAQAPDARDVSCPTLGTWDAEAARFEAEVLDLVNAARAQGASCGSAVMPPKDALVRSPELACVARAYAKRMSDHNFFSHIGDDGSSVVDRIEAAQIAWHGVGENIASGQATPEAVMRSWLTSEGHCRNLFGDFALLGVGYYRGVWVQDFVQP